MDELGQLIFRVKEVVPGNGGLSISQFWEENQ